MALFKKRNGAEREYQHFTWTMILFYMYIVGIAERLLMSLANLIFICIRPAAQTAVISTESGLRFYFLSGYAQLRRETVPIITDASAINGKIFAVTFLVLDLIAHQLPLILIAWKGCQILHIMKHSHSPFVPEVAEHICWIGRISLFTGLFGKFIIQAGMSAMIDHRFWFENPFELPWILAGLILLLVSDIFKKGCILQKEADETL